MLLLTIHDVTPKHEALLREITDMLKTLGLAGRYSMLVIPDYWHEAPLAPETAFADWLRAEESAGVEMLLHGFYHLDEVEHASPAKAWLARKLTAREGEFFGLSEAEAGARIERGRRVLEQVLAKNISGFVAPAWLYSSGTRTALKSLAFDIAEDHAHVWSPVTGKTLVRGPVLSYASRSEQHIRSSLFWSKWGTRLLQNVDCIRMAIHPGDFTVPVLRAEIERVILHLSKRHEPICYRDLLNR